MQYLHLLLFRDLFLGGKGFTAPSDKLNIACGIGGKGSVDVNGVSSENIIALCDVDQKRAQEKSMLFNNKNAYEAFPNAKRYEDFREMLETEKDIDAVTISTPDHTHAVITMAAMKKGKHVYTQKPITRTIFEPRKIVEYAKKAGIITQMGNQGHANEGDIGVGLPGPYEIAYGALVPKKEECTNLLVSLAVSASHIAFGSIRMEPVFMILGQSAAVAACMAIDENIYVQDVEYEKLKKLLLEKGQVLTMDNAIN